MGDLTRHFNTTEFLCKCGCTMPAEYWHRLHALAVDLEKLRAVVGRPITIVSGYRCPARNAEVGGAQDSEHLTARAVDLTVHEWPGERLRGAAEALIALEEMTDGGLGTYSDRLSTLHYDHGRQRRWGP